MVLVLRNILRCHTIVCVCVCVTVLSHDGRERERGREEKKRENGGYVVACKIVAWSLGLRDSGLGLGFRVEALGLGFRLGPDVVGCKMAGLW
jgi:hypothetical protein